MGVAPGAVVEPFVEPPDELGSVSPEKKGKELNWYCLGLEWG